MQLYKYKDYNGYLESQKEANERKLNWVWAAKAEIKYIAQYIKKNDPGAAFGICHGVRNGLEVKWFKEFLGINMLGTDIAETAQQFDDVIQWDFHKIKDEWVGSVDFIFSNALDHSYDPEMCLDQWMKCVKRDGFCLVEWTKESIGAKPSDPFGASMVEYKRLINIKFRIRDILVIKKKLLCQSDDELDKSGYFPAGRELDRYVFVIQHKRRNMVERFLLFYRSLLKKY